MEGNTVRADGIAFIIASKIKDWNRLLVESVTNLVPAADEEDDLVELVQLLDQNSLSHFKPRFQNRNDVSHIIPILLIVPCIPFMLNLDWWPTSVI